MKKIKDPYPITDVYHVTSTLVDAATVVVTDLCENLSNSIDTHCDDIIENLKKINTNKYNSISIGNSADGIYPVWIGVDKNNRVRKIFASINSGNYDYDNEKNRKLISWSWDKSDLNDQFFLNRKSQNKRIKLFDMKIKSGAIAIADYGGHFGYEHHDFVIESLNEKYFKNDNIFQNNYPIGLFIFNYGNKEVSSPSSFKSSRIHDEKIINISNFKKLRYIEFLSNLLDENCYPTKYIFEKYIVEEKDYRNNIEVKIIDEKISANYLIERLPKALQILKKQNQILFGKNFKEVHEIRKSQFENLIYGIIRDIETQELNLSVNKKKLNKEKFEDNQLYVETPGLPYIQETFFDGFKLKSEPSLTESATIPVKNGKYPCYIHTIKDESDDDGYQWESIYVVVEGLENCYLNRNSKGQVFFDKKFRESLHLREHINKKTKAISIDKVDLRNTENLKELEKISFVEQLELSNFKDIKNWDGLSKLKKLKKLKLVSCDINFSTAENFFKNLYSLQNLEELAIDDSSRIARPNKSKFPKNLFLKKLKFFRIDFREDWKKGDENFTDHRGYGNEKLWFISNDLPNIYQFPNIEKFKSLEKLSLYNYFNSEQKEGTLFNYEYGFEDYFETINKLCKNSNIKDIWIYGYSFNKATELIGTRFLDAVLKITKDTKVKINGISRNKLNDVFEKPFSSNSLKIKNLTLISKVQDIYEDKVISQKNNEIILNYFGCIQDKKENRVQLNDALSQPLETIVIKNSRQFFRSECIYDDTIEPVEEHLDKNNKLSKIIFEFDSEVLNGYGDMDGSWGSWENEIFAGIIYKWMNKYKNLKITIRFYEFKNESKDIDLQNLTNFGEFLIVFLIKMLQKNPKFRNRINILDYDSKKIDEIISNYLKDKVEGIIVIGDHSYQKDKNFDNIEILTKSMFEMGDLKRTAATVPISYENGDKNYSEFWSRFIENFYLYDGKNYILDAFKHDWEGHGDNTIIFVKESFLNSNNKVIFQNIKNYFYFAQDIFDENSGFYQFYKQNTKFTFPASIKFNKAELIYINGGGKLKFGDLIKQVDVSALKKLSLFNVLDTDLSIPFMPNLETLSIEHRLNEDSNVEIWGDKKEQVIYTKENEKGITYNGFKNLPKLINFTIFNLKAECIDKKNKYKNQQAKIDFKGVNKLKNLKEVSLGGYDYRELKKCNELRYVENLTFSGFDSDPNHIVNHKTFDFLYEFKNLKKFDFHVSHYHDDGINFNNVLFLNYLSKNLENLKLSINIENKQRLYDLYKSISKRFKDLTDIDLYTSQRDNGSKVIDSGYSGDKTNYIDKKTGKKFIHDKGPNPTIIDVKIFEKLKKLKKLIITNYDPNGSKVRNLVSVLKMKKLKKIILDGHPEVYATKDLIKINKILKKPALNFFNQCKKRNSKIKDKYDLEGNDWKKYQKLDREIEFGYGSSDTAANILKERMKKS